MIHRKRYLTLAMAIAMLLSTLCVVSMMATADDTAAPDILYLDPANCADLVPAAYTKGENNTFEVEGSMRWYFSADILKQYRYITVTISGLDSGCYVPLWGDVWLNGNTAAGNLTSNRLFNGTSTIDLALEDLSSAGYTGLSLMPEGVAAGDKVTMTVSLHKTSADDKIYLDPANCADLVPAAFTKGENNTFEVEGHMRWYFDPAVIKGYNYITVTISGLDSGCYVPLWGDVWLNGNTAAGNLTSNRLFNGTATIDLTLENLSSAGYTGLSLMPEGVADGDKVTMTVSLSKNDPAEKMFLDPANCADIVPASYMNGDNHSFTAEGDMRWYFPSNMDAYRYIIISVNPWGDGNLIPQWGDQWMNGNSEAGNLVSQRILGGNVATDNTIIVLDRSLESFTPAYNGLQLLGENIAAGTDISYNYVCLSKNAFPPLFNTPEKPDSSDPEPSAPESSTPESSAPESSAPDVPMIPKTIELKFADATVADNVIAEAMGDGFKMYVDPDQTGIYKNIGDVRWNMKLDLGSLETLTVDAAENNTAFFMSILICNEYGDPVDSLASPTYINGQPGKHTYNLAAAMAQKNAAYHEGEWNVIISLGIDDGGNKNALLYNTFNSLVIETDEMIPAPESSEDNKNEEKPGNPNTGVETALPLVMLAVAASGALALTRKKQ